MVFLERVDWADGVRLSCPVCGTATTGLQETQVRGGVGGRAAHLPVLVIAEPCGCEVSEHAAVLQHDAILLEHEIAQHRPAARPVPARDDPDTPPVTPRAT